MSMGQQSPGMRTQGAKPRLSPFLTGNSAVVADADLGGPLRGLLPGSKVPHVNSPSGVLSPRAGDMFSPRKRSQGSFKEGPVSRSRFPNLRWRLILTVGIFAYSVWMLQLFDGWTANDKQQKDGRGFDMSGNERFSFKRGTLGLNAWHSKSNGGAGALQGSALYKKEDEEEDGQGNSNKSSLVDRLSLNSLSKWLVPWERRGVAGGHGGSADEEYYALMWDKYFKDTGQDGEEDDNDSDEDEQAQEVEQKKESQTDKEQLHENESDDKQSSLDSEGKKAGEMEKKPAPVTPGDEESHGHGEKDTTEGKKIEGKGEEGEADRGRVEVGKGRTEIDKEGWSSGGEAKMAPDRKGRSWGTVVTRDVRIGKLLRRTIWKSAPRQIFVTAANHAVLRANNPIHFPHRLPSQHPHFRFRSCAVVGSSGSLTGAGLGPAIDRHDAVVRANQALTAGYEKDVGAKTTFRILNRKWTAMYGSAKAGRTVLLPAEVPGTTIIATHARSEDFERLQKMVLRERPDVQVLLLSSTVIRRTRHLIRMFRAKMQKQGREYVGGNAPSSALVAMYLMMQMCDRVTVYGVSGEDSNSADTLSWPYHYYLPLVGPAQSVAEKHHSYTLEGDLMKELAMAGGVTFCFSRGSEKGSAINDRERKECEVDEGLEGVPLVP